jgi:peroxiredoxin
VANQLTGDFDVVAQFSLPAVNRLLAAMHAIQRFPHSLSLRVDDIPQPPDRFRPPVFEIIDVLGESVANPRSIRLPELVSTQPPAAGSAFSRFDGIVNMVGGVFELPPFVPSQLRGRAQLQFSPPTLEIADAAASKITVRMQIKARYFADRNTPPAAEFAKGDLVLTTAVHQITSQVGNVVDIDLRSNAVQASFVPTWSSRVLSPEDQAGINLLIGNALKASVLPSNNALPSNIRSMKFKALAAGAAHAAAVLINTTSAPGNPATVTSVFLGGQDFAFGLGAETIKGALQPLLDEFTTKPIPDIKKYVGFPYYSTVTYKVTIFSAVVNPEPGRILITITGHADDNRWWAPSFDFTAKQAFGLQPDGSTANLVVGDLSFDTTSTLGLAEFIEGRIKSEVEKTRDAFLQQSDVVANVRQMLDADRNLGGFLRSLLTPARPDGQPQPAPLGVSMTYTAADITGAGVVLRGSVVVAALPPPHVEFDEMQVGNSGPVGGVTPSGTEYSGFKSWIPGGAITSYEWKRFGVTQPGFQDDKKFVLVPEEPGIVFGSLGSDETASRGTFHAFQPMCVTIRGTRLSASGPVSMQPVTASYCAFQWFPLFEVAADSVGLVPLVALTRPGSRGEVEVVGHAPAVRAEGRRARPNLIAHFGSGDNADQLQRLSEALKKSRRGNAPTAIVAVMTPDEMARTRHVAGVVYVDAQDGAWERVWRVKVAQRPATVVMNPAGHVVWQYDGEIDASAAADALRRVLGAGRMPPVTLVSTGARIGHAPPNFMFPHVAGSDLTLRKLIGRPVILVFWRSASAPSIEAARAVSTSPPNATWRNAVVLAVNDGESREIAEKAAAAANITATVVSDSGRAISRAYGITAWPTVVFLDARGVLREVRQGRGAVEGEPDILHGAPMAAR